MNVAHMPHTKQKHVCVLDGTTENVESEEIWNQKCNIRHVNRRNNRNRNNIRAEILYHCISEWDDKYYYLRANKKAKELTASFLPIDLLCERERLILKKESFFVAERGGDDMEDSCPFEAILGGGDIAWSRPVDKLSTLGDELTVLDLGP